MGENQYLLKSIIKFESGLLWTIFHVLLGVLATISPYPIIAWYYLLILDTIRAFIIVNSRERNLVLAYAILYFASFELIGRMSSSSPYIPYESSKYIMMLLSVTGIVTNIKSIKLSNVGFWIFILLLPSLFVDQSGMVTFNDYVFNVFGIFNIALALIFFSMVKVSRWQFIRWIRFIAFPMIPVLIYTFLKTPDYSELEFELSANFDTTGGFGSNQVSTVLGLGAFLFAVALIINYRITTIKLLDIAFLAGFTIQGLLTFSRGGMIGGAIGIITLVYFLLKLKSSEFKRYRIPNPKKYILPTLLAFVVLFVIGNIITSGNLILRYQGQTAGTMTGRHEVDLNKFTSNRWELLVEDAIIWMDYPVFGSGAASSKYLRFYTKGEVAHVEFSRLLAEHGLMGILITLIFFKIYFDISNSRMDGLNKAVIMSFFILGIFTSFHAATRTFLTPLLVSLAYIVIIEPRPKKNRKKSSFGTSKFSPLASHI